MAEGSARVNQNLGAMRCRYDPRGMREGEKRDYESTEEHKENRHNSFEIVRLKYSKLQFRILNT